MRKPHTAKAAPEAQDLRQRAAQARDAAGRFNRRRAPADAPSAEIDTDVAREAFANLEAAVNGQTAALAAATVAMEAATAEIGASIPTVPGSH